jgi:4-hydroxybenzoate polyprenyltransferase
LRASARKHKIKLSTLKDRCAGSQDITTAHQKNLSLTVEQEDDIVNYIIERERAFQPLTKQEIHDFAQALSSVNGEICYLGKNWVDRFLTRHPTIEMKPSQVIDSSRKHTVTKKSLSEYYKGLEWVVNDKKITSPHIYNVDETGV